MGRNRKPERISAVYCLTSRRTGEKYIGASGNVATRLKVHRAKQGMGSWSFRLAEAMRTPDEIQFEILERCDQSQLREREQWWIAHLAPALNCSKRQYPEVAA